MARSTEMIGDELGPATLTDTESSIIHRLDDIVSSRPDRLAAHFADTDLTWAELDQRSNELALRLHAELGPGPEPIAIVSVSGPDMVIAPVAILKSGRPYTWIDVTGPLSRSMQILSMSESRSAVVGALTPDLHDALDSAELSLHQVGTARATHRPKVSVSGTDPASIVFTSGSTGTPKGVVIPHRYYILHAVTCPERGMTSDDRVGLVIPMSYAYGAIVFWRTLMMGASLFPYDPRELGVDSFASWTTEKGIEILDATPSLLRAVARATTGTMDSLRVVESAGEPLFARDAADISRWLPPECAFRNSIGSSETGAYAFYQIPPFGDGLKGIVPVGTGTPHKQITLCDHEGNTVPRESTGEVVVTSSFSAIGYWRQPELTDRRFTVTADGRTSYHSGDLGRWLPDGSLVHLGRSDDMVKIRGYLVEPAEVEAALLDTGLVLEAAAFGAIDEDGRTMLCAYVVPIDGLRSSNAAIRLALRERVPEYIVPRSLVAIPEMPRNENGKIDRARLKPTTQTDTNPMEPRDDWERAVAQLWCSILGLESVGVDDDFFSLGGDSLAVLELIEAMAEDHDVTVHTSDLVECPTLDTFAKRARKPVAARRGILVPLHNEGEGPPLFCFAGGGGFAGDFVLLARYLGLDRPVYGFQGRGFEGRGLPDWTARRWATRCLREIRRIQPSGPYYLAGHSFGGMLAWEAAQILKRAGEEVALLVIIDTLSPSSTEFARQSSDRATPSSGLKKHSGGKALKSMQYVGRLVDRVRKNQRSGTSVHHRRSPGCTLQSPRPLSVPALPTATLGRSDRDLPSGHQSRRP